LSSAPDEKDQLPRTQPGDGERYRVDAREAQGLLVGDQGTQINYFYKGTWTDGVAPPPLVSMSGTITSPYRGLSAFGERDAALFFGREAAATEVLERMSRRLQGTGLVVVSGVSGAGKSSLLRAGVLPRLRGAGLGSAPEAASWPCLVFTPGGRPLEELAVRVAPVAGADAASLRRGLSDDPAGFALTARQAALTHLGSPEPDGGLPDGVGQRRVLLVVDQFEQLFTQCQNEDERQAFITALHAAAATEGGEHQLPAALVVLLVRADFEARLADYPLLALSVQYRYLLTAMTERQLRMAITQPAVTAGSSVDEDLVQVLLEEVRTRSGSPAGSGRPAISAGVLPLLSHALDQAWRGRTGQAVTLADYERTGGIEGAVASTAQRAYDRLTPTQQTTARQVFTRLTATTGDAVDTSVRAARADLAAGKDDAQVRDVEAVLETFTADRLLTLAAGTVEISHEALLTAWPLLRDTWLADTHADRVIRTRLQATAEEWNRASRDPSYLYSGSRLDIAAEAAARIDADGRQVPLGQAEEDFLRASRRANRRRIRRRQGFTATLLALVVGLAAVSVAAVHASQVSMQQRDRAVSSQLASQSELIGDNDPVKSRLLSIAAWRLDPSDGARYAMLAAGALPGVNVIPAGNGTVYSVAFSPDGQTLASGDSNGTIQLWDAATGQPMGKPLNGNAGEVNSVAFSPNGQTLASGSDDHAVQLWDVATRKLTANLSLAGVGTVNTVNSVAFSPNGQTLASGSNAAVQLWDVATRKLTANLPTAGVGTVNSVAFSPDGQTLASGNHNGTIWLWNLTTGQPAWNTLPVQADAINAVAFSPDGQTLASGSNGVVQLWNAATGQQIRNLLTGDAKPVNAVAFSPNGTTAASGSNNETIQLWNVATGQQIGPSLLGHIGWVESVAFSPGGQFLASGSVDHTIRLWNVAADQPVALTGHAGPVNSVAFSPSGKILASGSGSADGTIRLWNAVTGRPMGTPLTGYAGGINSVAFSPDGKTLACGYANGTVQLWNAATGRPAGRPLTSNSGAVNAVAFSRDGTTLAGGYAHGTIRLWDTATHQPIGKPLPSHAGPVTSVAFSPDGKTLAIGDADSTVELWNVATYRQVSTLTGHAYAVNSVAFSPDGTTLASGGADYTIRLWDTATHTLSGPLNGGTEAVNSVAFSPGSELLASGGADGTVRLWDVATGQQIGASFTGQAGQVNSVAFSPDGTTVAGGSADGTVQLWDVAYARDTVRYLCAVAGRSLTRAEWTSDVGTEVGYQNVCP